MLVSFFSHNNAAWGIPLLIQIICYVRILNKMGKRSLMGVIPVLGEMEMSKDLFRRRRSFWRPAVIAVVLLITAKYLESSSEIALYLKLAATLVYGIFLMRLYIRLAGQFGKGFLFKVGIVVIPPLFLVILAFGKSVYLGPKEFPRERPRTRLQTNIRRAGFAAISAAEFIALVAACFMLTIIVHPARPIAEYMLQDTLDKFSSVTDSDEIISRADTMGEGYEAVVENQRTRDYFFPDHSGDSKVVVMEYVIGADLEDNTGAASVNIAQMLDSTAKGDGLDFVMQAGGSVRWFTKGIEDSSVGRYLISGGELTKVEDLDDTMCMSEPDNLKDFIVWTKENYPADRYMLVLWDHGGGFASGYGYDILNKRQGDSTTMTASEIIKAIKGSDVKFDLVGFDACLMQDVEYANALEKCADYYLASEETEPSYGWFYTAGFGKLAEDPTLSTEEFGRSMISSYDQLYRKTNDGEPRPECTLSLVDLTLVRPVYKKLMNIYSKATEEMKDSPAVFANLSAARSKAYLFADKQQVDLVSFMTGLKKADYRQQVASDETIDELIEAAKACVVYSNKDAAEGINGIAIDYTYDSLDAYSYQNKELKAVKYKTEENFFNVFCSIMASQQMRADADEGGFLQSLLTPDYSSEDWYIEGFDKYDTADLFIDIPVTQTDKGYLADLPDKTWDTVLDCETSAYIPNKSGKASQMYIGREHFGDRDEDGHYYVQVGNTWAHIDGNLVCYESEGFIEGEEGIIYKGTVKARLNDTEDITLYVEYDPVKAVTDENMTGHITGYTKDDDDLSIFRKGMYELETGDTIEFLFDMYDEEGNYVKTEGNGSSLRVVKQESLTVKDEPFDAGTEIECYGILTDVYQRELMTEAITAKF